MVEPLVITCQTCNCVKVCAKVIMLLCQEDLVVQWANCVCDGEKNNKPTECNRGSEGNPSRVNTAQLPLSNTRVSVAIALQLMR